MARARGMRTSNGARQAYVPPLHDEPIGDATLLFWDLRARQQQRLPEGEVRLWVAVIKSVVEDLGSESAVVRAWAIEWLNDYRRTGAGIVDVAELLGLEVDVVREALLAQVRAA